MLREVRMYSHRPLLLFVMLVAPLIVIFYFTSLMGAGLPSKLPSGLVDEDDTAVTRNVTRILATMQETKIVEQYSSFTEARQAVQRGEIFGFFYIPKGLTDDAIANRQPTVSFYTNEAYYVPGALLVKDFKLTGELSGIAITRESLYARGLTERQAMGVVQPIVVETHPLNNPYLNYGVCLCNMLVPGVIFLIIMITAAYTIGIEWKRNTQLQLYKLCGGSPALALMGKLLPQTFVYSFVFVFMDVYLYRYLGYPCKSGLLPMMLTGVLTVIASQSLAIFIYGLFAGHMRFAMCSCSLWGVVAFSLTGFSFPVTAVDTPLQVLSWFFPLRHYFLIYVNQALNGYSIAYAWKPVISLLIFTLLPLTVMWRYKVAFVKYKYKP